MASSDQDQSNIDYSGLRQKIEAVTDESALYSAVVNIPFEQKVEMAFLFLGIIMLALVDPKTKLLEAKAISETDFVKEIDDMAVMPLDKIHIHPDDADNLLVQAITSGQPKTTTDWTSLLNPVMEPDSARFTQASGGIAFTAVYPLNGVGDGGALVYSFFERGEVNAAPQDTFMSKYTSLVIDTLKSKRS